MKYNRPHSTAAWGLMAKDWEQGIDYHRLSLERLKRAQGAIHYAGLGGGRPASNGEHYSAPAGLPCGSGADSEVGVGVADQSIWFSSFDGNVWAPQQEIAAWTSPDLLRVKRLQAELRDAQAALKLSEEKQDAVVGAAALRHARRNAKFGKELAAMLRAEVKAQADRAIVADLLVDDASQLAKAG
jgi:hypothetical protein